MKFVQKELVETADISGGTKGQFSELGRLLLWAAGAIATIYLLVYLAVSICLPLVSIELESRIFGSIRHPGISPDEDDERLSKLKVVLNKLIACDERVLPYNYKLVVMDDRTPNAFAMPGGTIGVTSGLLKMLKSDIAVAFVLGHELGHFKNRDHIRRLGHVAGLNILIAVIFGGEIDAFSGQAFNLINSSYSRMQEESADEFGVELVHKVYGQHEDFTQFFEKMEKRSKSLGWSYMFSSHPTTKSRIKAIKRKLKTLAK